MNEKMRLNVVDDTDPALISKKFWKYVKSKTKSTRIPETVWYKTVFETKLLTKLIYSMNISLISSHRKAIMI